MIFKRERGIRRDSPKADVLAMEPTAYSKPFYEITGQRIFYIYLGDRTLARGTSSTFAWRAALRKLKQERERE